MNIRLEHLAFRTVLGKRRGRQGISLPHPIKAGAAAPRGPMGQATVDYLTGQGNTVQNERE